ncbi:MAG: valine--tRNA ligase, partial [Acidobacteria bacterium]
YIEFIKPKITDEQRTEVSTLSFDVLFFVFDQALKLLHPFMPFITEELWQRLPHQGLSITVQPFPRSRKELIDSEVERQVEVLEEIIIKIRNVRAEMNVDAGKRVHVNLASSVPGLRALLIQSIPYIRNLARCEEVKILAAIGQDTCSARTVASGVAIEIPLAGLIDLGAEKSRIQREIFKIEKEMTPIQQKLLDQNFLDHAPEQVVRLNQNRLFEFQEKLNKLNENLKRLS